MLAERRRWRLPWRQRERRVVESPLPPSGSGVAAPGGAVLGWLRRGSARDRSRWARRALDWPLVNYLEGAVWLLNAVTLGVSYYGSYDNLVDVLAALGYSWGPRHVVPIALDAPLTCSVIGQFLLARWKSPATKRWRLFAVTLITAPLSLAGNALHGALRFDGDGSASLDLSLLDVHRADVVIRLVAAMVPAIGIILAVAVTELVLRERARLEELRDPEREARRAAPERQYGAADSRSEPRSRDRATVGSGSSRVDLRQSGQRREVEVLELVRAARHEVAAMGGGGRVDEEIAARVTAVGHRITASRVRTYLARLRAEERRESEAREPDLQEVVA